MSALSPYSLALLLNEGSFSCVKAAQSLGFVSHDALTRSLLKRWRDPGVINWDALPKSGVLVVDDTVIAKPHSEHISHVVWTYDSSEGHVVRGISFLLALWIDPILKIIVELQKSVSESGWKALALFNGFSTPSLFHDKFARCGFSGLSMLDCHSGDQA